MPEHTTDTPAVGPWRVAIAGLIGTTIEWYDFFIYGLAVASVFAPRFFPSASPVASTLAALSTFAIGFVARPLGGALIGHYGDRIGRKRMLVLSLLVMGTATAAIGVLPTYAAIGVAAPITLLVLRFAQGFAVGGEWGGATLLALEHARSPRQRTLLSALPQVGLPAGVLLGSVVFLAVRTGVGDAAFVEWGWRIPFLASAVLVVFGLLLRLRLGESPEFERIRTRQGVRRAPLGEVLRAPRVWIPAAGIPVATTALGNILLVFLAGHAAARGLFGPTVILLATLVGAVVWGAAVPIAALAAARFGRRPVLAASMAGVAVWAFPYFWLVETGGTAQLLAATTVAAALIGVSSGPFGAYITEAFPTTLRYSGSSVAYGAGSVLGGAIAPLVATMLYAASGSTSAIAGYLVLNGVISVIATVSLRSPVSPSADAKSVHPEPDSPPALA